MDLDRLVGAAAVVAAAAVGVGVVVVVGVGGGGGSGRVSDSDSDGGVDRVCVRVAGNDTPYEGRREGRQDSAADRGPADGMLRGDTGARHVPPSR